jgi:hypothetical protein
MEFLGDSNLHTVESHFFMAHEVFDSPDNRYVFFKIVAPVGPIPFGVQLWYFFFPLPKQVDGDTGRFTDLTDAQASLGKKRYHTEFSQGISSASVIFCCQTRIKFIITGARPSGESPASHPVNQGTRCVVDFQDWVDFQF